MSSSFCFLRVRACALVWALVLAFGPPVCVCETPGVTGAFRLFAGATL